MSKLLQTLKTQTVSKQWQSEEQQNVLQERSKLVTYTVKLPNGAKFTRLDSANSGKQPEEVIRTSPVPPAIAATSSGR